MHKLNETKTKISRIGIFFCSKLKVKVIFNFFDKCLRYRVSRLLEKPEKLGTPLKKAFLSKVLQNLKNKCNSRFTWAMWELEF